MIFKGDQLYKDGIYIDENIELDYMLRETALQKVSKKATGKDIIDSQLVFRAKQSEFSPYTNLAIGDKFYISFPDKTIEAPVSFYSVTNTPYSGYELHSVMDIPPGINIPAMDYSKNVTVCTKNKNCSAVNYENLNDNAVLQTIKNSLSKYTNSIKVIEDYPDEAPEYIIIKGSFISPGSTEYAVSYVKRLSFDRYASGVFIVSENGEKITEVISFLKSDFNYNKLNAIVDYNGDGLYELLTENGYYEGAGYQLWKYSSPSFIMITTGFNWGV